MGILLIFNVCFVLNSCVKEMMECHLLLTQEEEEQKTFQQNYSSREKKSPKESMILCITTTYSLQICGNLWRKRVHVDRGKPAN